MRLAAVLTLLALLLPGCSGGGGGDAKDDGSAADFEDLDVAATDTTGILVGVVVDDAIRPLKGAAVTATGPDAQVHNQTTDDEGRFAFGELAPGSYIVEVQLLNYLPAQTSAAVTAGDDDPKVVRVQLVRLFSKAAYVEQLKFEGFLSCSISFPVGTTCVNDYTRLAGQVCPGGCLQDYELSKAAGNIREYTYTVSPDWQSIVFETTWKRTSDYSSGQLALLVSYASRVSTSHYHARIEAESPILLRVDLGKDAPGAREDPNPIPPEGTNELFVFFNSGGIPPGGGVVVNQAFQNFQHTFYNGLPPDGWSFVNGDPLPF